MEVAQLAVDAGDGVAGLQPLVDIVLEIAAADVGQFFDRGALAQEAPQAEMSGPEAANGVFQPGGAPVALLDVLVTGQLVDEPFRQPLRVGFRGKRGDFDLDLAAPVGQKAAELEHGVAAYIGPARAELLGSEEIQPAAGGRSPGRAEDAA